MTNFFEGLWILIVFILGTILFFSPLIISVFTGNYWYMFLFLISWIPMLYIFIVGRALIE
jgi:hypothetical protein